MSGRPPVTPLVTTPLGAYNATRTDPRTASCGIGKHPCVHKGIDIIGEPGTLVRAPADGWVLVSATADKGPFQGYGPAVVLLAHDDRALTGPARRGSLGPGIGPAVSLRYSLLAHLDPAHLRYQVPYAKGEKTLTQAIKVQLGPVTDTSSLHDSDRQTGPEWIKLDDGTVERRRPFPDWAIPVKEGWWLGRIGKERHVHWEVRNAPLAGNDGRLDPEGWLSVVDPTGAWKGLPPSKIVTAPNTSAGGAGGLLLLAGGLYLILKD